MKFKLPLLVAVALLAGFLHDPKPLSAQNKDILALQRDIYDLTKKIEDLKDGQSGRSTQLEALLKQLMEANTKLVAESQALQDTLRRNQTEQQQRVFEPMAAVKQGVEDVSGNVSAVQANLNTMRTRQEALEEKVNDLSAAVRLLASQTPPPQPAVPAADAASLLFSSAQQDRLTGQLNSALGKFNDIAMNHPTSPLAPMALIEMGAIYAHNAQPEDAVKSFDRVLEQFGDNPMRKDAQFKKAEQLAILNRDADAAREYESFATQYPADENAAEARARAKALKAAPARGKQTKSKR